MRLSLYSSFAALALSTLVAHGTPITYVESTLASGTFDGITFANKLVTITLTQDTANVENESSPGNGFYDTYASHGVNAAFNVAGLSSDTSTDSFFVFDNQNVGGNNGVAGLTNFSSFLIDTEAPAFTTYNLQSFFGPITGTPEIYATYTDSTTRGSINLTSVGNTTFQAIPAATPEPSSFILLGTGLVGMFGVARRKYMSA